MSGFAVPYSSSPPSTPDSRTRTPNGHASNLGSFSFNNSTTPAGPPPSSTVSFTPAGPPPSSSFLASSHPSQQFQSSLRPNLKKPLFSSPVAPLPSDDEEMNEEDDGEEQVQDFSEASEGSIEDYMDIEGSSNNRLPFSSSMGQSLATAGGPSLRDYGSSIMSETPRGIKRSRGGAAISYGSPRRAVKSSSPKKETPLPAIAKDMASQMGLPILSESDQFILGIEASLHRLHDDITNTPNDLAVESRIPAAVEELSHKWRSSRIEYLRDSRVKESEEEEGRFPDLEIGILPDESEPNWYKATFLATFLLQLHHPPAARGMQALAVSSAGRKNPFSVSLTSGRASGQYNSTALPKVLLQWLNHNSRQYDHLLEEIYVCDPNPTAHEGYWDMILSLIIRGQVAEVIHLFRKSNFQHARTSREDGHGKIGYDGTILKNVDRVVKQAIQLLERCPALQEEGNWDVTGSDWALFRKRVEQVMNDLRIFAEGRDRDANSNSATFEAPNFGIKASGTKITRSARKAESQVPWTIYQNLQTMYGILIGETTEILSSAQDWIEATIGLVAWWDGEEDDEIAVGSLAVTRRSLRKSLTRGSRLVDVNSKEAYLRRLSHAFEKVTDDANEGLFQISSISPVEVGLASIFEGNVEGILGILHGWSLPVASAVADIASLGGWYNPGPSNGMEGFDESDLLVLSSYGQRDTDLLSRDSILTDYAEKLVEIDFLGDTKHEKTLEGWELSTKIYSRLQDSSTAQKKLLSLIKKLALTSQRRVDKLMRACKTFGFEAEAFDIAERYADSVAESTEQYGVALIYYARAHSRKKVKNVFDLLISLSLVQSLAFPPFSALDISLQELVSEPEYGLGRVAFHDEEAASILHLYLTGYATLRKFYDLRDEECNLKDGERPKLRPMARKRDAAATLIALITSASDSIYGGLYDESRGSVVHVDGLLALLGEAMVFVNKQPAVLSQNQIFVLLSAIESLETVSRSIYKPCEDCFTSAILSYHNSLSPTSSREMMRKTVSSLTSSSGFSLVGSEMLGESMTSGGGSGSMVKLGGMGTNNEDKTEAVKRGWDWRKGVRSDAKGEDVLRILRLGLAREMAKAWIGSS